MGLLLEIVLGGVGHLQILVKGDALQQVRMDLAVAALVKAEELEATAEEIEAEMKSVADKYGMDLDTIKKYLPEADVREQVLRLSLIHI